MSESLGTIRETVLKEEVSADEARRLAYEHGLDTTPFDLIRYCAECGERVGTATLTDPHTNDTWTEMVEFDYEEWTDSKTGEKVIRLLQQTHCPYRTHWCRNEPGKAVVVPSE